MRNERVVISGYGTPSVLRMVTEELSAPQSGEVRIRIEAAGVSFGDILQRTGLFFAGAPKMPYSPGYDVVGIVDAVGDEVTKLKTGDRVAALTMFGGYSRFINIPAAWAVIVPPELDPPRAVALVLNYITAWQMLHRVARLREDQTILVYGGSGGVGTAMLDLSRYLGLRVAAAISKARQKEFSREVEFLFDEQDHGSAMTLRNFKPDGFDAAFDPIGGSHVWRTRSFLSKHGRLIAFGVSSAVKPGGHRNSTEVVRLGLLIAFSKFWNRPEVHLYAIDQRVKTLRHEINQDLGLLLELLGRGAVSPRIGAIFPLHQAKEAHELLESRTNIGKIVLKP